MSIKYNDFWSARRAILDCDLLLEILANTRGFETEVTKDVAARQAKGLQALERMMDECVHNQIIDYKT